MLPVDQPVVLKMNSEDVLHSFWVPEFRVKQDLVPGYEQELRFEPTVMGDYKVRCAEICGLSHTTMIADVRVVSQSEFDAWVEERLTKPAFAEMTPEERGAIWYSGGDGDWAACSGCHSLDGATLAGPTWLGIYGRSETLTDGSTVTVDDAYIRQSIQDPNSQIVEGFNPNIMPQDYQERFEAAQAQILADEGVEIDIIADIIAYMQTLEE
jgi:cytochrome c oxidase subunit 2